jgi:hypothetical protein
MQVWQIMAIGVVVAIAAVLGWWLYERNRTQRLRERFGPEYDRRVTAIGRRQAESELVRSESRVQKLKGQPLSASDRTRFMQEWRLCQARFVDDPGGAVIEADRILTDIMRVRGYSVDDRYDRVSDICAAYPTHSSSYHDANDILIRHRRNNASTEDLRKAFVNFRSLFDDALGGQREEERERAA